ncbi:MAG: membrane associated rhomboid family serine protease [Verrucomicrobiales bacterium]|jgi:membrane associated rhomboid family serine protease
MSETTKVPWAEEPNLAEKPAGVEYGYVSIDGPGRKPTLHGSTLEELKVKVESGEAVQVVMPGFERVAPPSIVEELWPAVQERERHRRASERKNSFINLCLFGAIALYSFKSRDSAWQMVLILFVLFGVVPMGQYLIGALRRKIQGEPTFDETRQRTLFAFWLGAGDVLATRWCVRAIIAIFVAQVAAAALGSGDFFAGLFQNAFVIQGRETIEAAALTKPLDGDWWRLLTCGLVHGGLLHIGFNMMAFKSVGEVLERFYGRSVLLITFLLSVLGGSIASVTLMPGKPSVGASGGILGLVGFLLVVGLRHRAVLPPDLAKSIVRSVLFMAALGWLAKDYIDNAAHAGGFLVGCLLALPLSKDVRQLGRYQESGWMKKCGWATAAVLALTGAWVLVRLALVGR